MDRIKVKTKDLLERIRKNRQSHRDNFLAAQKIYRQDVIDELERRLKEARDGKEIRRGMTLPVPEDRSKDYDRVITMLEMSVDETIEINASQFENFVMDNWAWSAAVTASTLHYLNRDK